SIAATGRRSSMTVRLGLGINPRTRAAVQAPQRPQYFRAWQTLTRHRPDVRTGIASAVLHVIVIVLLAFSTRSVHSPSGATPQQNSMPVAVTMRYVPPKTAPARPKPPQPRPAPAPEAAAPKTPESTLPAPFSTPKAPEHDDPAAMSPEQKPASRAEDPEPKAPEAREPLEDQMVFEARRIFGPKAGDAGGPLTGPVQAGRPLALMGSGSRCSWGGDDAGADGGGPANGVVEGVVRNEGDGQPVAGAFLQLLGTGSATFADDAGHYRLHFDPKLVDRCHSQIVRVTAPGYRARTMVLAYGTWSDNVVDMRGR
ncbi:MAG TPA: hypothetical protein VGN76_12540, partial [Gemmatimonadales bacterium]|nr:hypothetical protein [Gemmatimonadales bacterium]